MRFDEFWGDDLPADGETLPVLPAGTHVVEITSATFKPLSFKKTDTNPTGMSLVITAVKPGFAPFELIVPANYRGLIEAICRSSRVALPAKGLEWDEHCLEGQTAYVETTIYEAKNGKSYVNVTKWVESTSPAAPKAAVPAAVPNAARPPAPQGIAGPLDDIPFAWMVPFVLAVVAGM